MDTNLRPLTLGEILDRTAQLYRTNFLLFAGIASIYSGALLVLSLLQIAVQEVLRMHHMAGQVVVATVVGMLLIWPIAVIAGGLSIAANNRAVAWLHLGQPATIRGAYASIRPRLGRYLGLMTITTLIIWLPFALLYAGYAIFTLLYIKPRGLLGPRGAHIDPQVAVVFLGVSVVFLLLLLGAMVYAVLMGLRYSLSVPACVVEDLRVRPAMRRSIELTKGARGRIFLLGLLVVAIQLGLGLITQLFFIVATVKHHGDLPALVRVLQQLVAFFTNTFVGPIYATGFTLFYYDQRVRKEGYDIERMMHAAGLGHLPLNGPQDSPGAMETPPAPMPSSFPDSGSANE
ncbi:MAG TPA: glycerophosphoryl diester phosphodiesterase membrane domain-containing protein [Terracidiphilus sp.]|jgi:hypothetical protein|nr:glycerophosphoryl diester phosphodiesterase membrane domain-containing protein [Terracidiphilus sp.]